MIRRIVAYEDHDAPMSRVEVPTLGVALILSFGPTMRVDGQTVSSFLVGMWDKPALTEHDGDAHGIQIDLAPAVAYALVGGRMDELTNRVIDVGDLEVVNVDRLLETGGAAAATSSEAVQRGPVGLARSRLGVHAAAATSVDPHRMAGGRDRVEPQPPRRPLSTRGGTLTQALRTGGPVQIGLRPTRDGDLARHRRGRVRVCRPVAPDPRVPGDGRRDAELVPGDIRTRRP